MNKVFFGTILSQANRQIQCMSVNIERAQNRFLVEKSISLALRELNETQKLLEQALENYKTNPPTISKLYLK